jgi:branched-chain amino acid transport system substrate-binding protein
MLFKTKFIPLAIALAFAGSAGAQEVIKIGHVGPVPLPTWARTMKTAPRWLSRN